MCKKQTARSQQCLVRNNFFGRRFFFFEPNWKGIPALHLSDCVLETLRAQVASVIRCLIPFITCQLTCLITFQASFQRVFSHLDFSFFENNEAVIRMVWEKSQSQCETRVTNSPCWSGLGIVHSTEQVADTLTRGAFATIIWKSLMWVVRHSSTIQSECDRNFSESSCSIFSLKTCLTVSNAYSSQRDFESAPWRFLKLRLEKANNLFPKRCLEKSNAFFGTRRRRVRRLLARSLS